MEERTLISPHALQDNASSKTRAEQKKNLIRAYPPDRRGRIPRPHLIAPRYPSNASSLTDSAQLTARGLYPQCRRPSHRTCTRRAEPRRGSLLDPRLLRQGGDEVGREDADAACVRSCAGVMDDGAEFVDRVRGVWGMQSAFLTRLIRRLRGGGTVLSISQVKASDR